MNQHLATRITVRSRSAAAFSVIFEKKRMTEPQRPT